MNGMESLLIFIFLLPFYFLTFFPIAHSQQQDLLNPPPSPSPPPPWTAPPPPPPPWTAPPPPPPPRHRDNQHPPPPPRMHKNQQKPRKSSPPPPIKHGMNIGEMTGLVFGGIIVILQFFVAGFLVVTRRRLFHGSTE